MREELKMKRFACRRAGTKKSLLPSKIIGSNHYRTGKTEVVKKKERRV
jgi:hypothetical protein